ncbi:MAG: type II toxin-antitoxin system HicB family antitoxin [Gaiellaceae bacterium]
MSDDLRITVRYTDAGDGWVTAQVVEVPGAISQGSTREEARANVIEALALVLTPDEELAGEPQSDDTESLTLTLAS